MGDRNGSERAATLKSSSQKEFGIRIIIDPPTCTTDVVLVHGLSGGRESTWVHPDGCFWPGDLLSQDLKQARIMTYGYDADYFKIGKTTSTNGLPDHGKSLAYAVAHTRCDEKVRHRPLIFIAYSLGGLVTEEALLYCWTVGEPIASLLKSTIGILFMGTPHNGSTFANRGGPFLRFMKIIGNANEEIIKSLAKNSKLVAAVGERFQQLLMNADLKSKPDIFCFYEALPVISAGVTLGVVVPRESAILRQYQSTSLHADHQNMTKFSGRDDNGYHLVCGILKGWIEPHLKPEVELSNAARSGKSISKMNDDITSHGHDWFSGLKHWEHPVSEVRTTLTAPIDTGWEQGPKIPEADRKSEITRQRIEEDKEEDKGYRIRENTTPDADLSRSQPSRFMARHSNNHSVPTTSYAGKTPSFTDVRPQAAPYALPIRRVETAPTARVRSNDEDLDSEERRRASTTAIKKAKIRIGSSSPSLAQQRLPFSKGYASPQSPPRK